MSSQRREQIIAASVRVIAREGCHGLSFAKVVQEAGLSSTRLISYHFGSREALLQETFAHVLARAGAFMGPRIAAEHTMRAKVRTYIVSNLEFIADDPTMAKAAVDLAATIGTAGGETSLELLESGFRAGQENGEMRGFDVHVAAVALRGLIDATVLDVVRGRSDAAAAGRELAEMFDRATRA